MQDTNASSPGANYSLKEEIRAYWSSRAASFDQQVGHAIKSDAELAAFQSLLRQSFGSAPLDVLDLAFPATTDPQRLAQQVLGGPVRTGNAP